MASLTTCALSRQCRAICSPPVTGNRQNSISRRSACANLGVASIGPAQLGRSSRPGLTVMSTSVPKTGPPPHIQVPPCRRMVVSEDKPQSRPIYSDYGAFADQLRLLLEDGGTGNVEAKGIMRIPSWAMLEQRQKVKERRRVVEKV